MFFLVLTCPIFSRKIWFFDEFSFFNFLLYQKLRLKWKQHIIFTRHAIKLDVFTLAKTTHIYMHIQSSFLIIILNKTSKNIWNSWMSAIDEKYKLLCLYNDDALLNLDFAEIQYFYIWEIYEVIINYINSILDQIYYWWFITVYDQYYQKYKLLIHDYVFFRYKLNPLYPVAFKDNVTPNIDDIFYLTDILL